MGQLPDEIVGDIFRCTVSFYHIFQPEYYESMIRSLIDIWKYGNYCVGFKFEALTLLQT